MECGKYRVVKDIHVFDCLHGQLKMRIGTIFEIMDNGQRGKSGDSVFCPEILRYNKDCYIRI